MAKAMRLEPAMDCLVRMRRGLLQVMPPVLPHRISATRPEWLTHSVAFRAAPEAA
jgi:hypothetical protein